MEESKDSPGLIFGIIIGVIIALALLSRRTETLSIQPPQQQVQEPIWQPMDIPRVDDIPQVVQSPPYQQSPQLIQLQQDPKLIEMVSQLQKTSSQLEYAATKLNELEETVSTLKREKENISQLSPPYVIVEQIPQPISQPQPEPKSQPVITIQPIQPIQSVQSQQPIYQPQQPAQSVEQIYKNSEQWKIVRGQNGRIKSLDIVRDVKKSHQSLDQL